jgi:membrane-associated protease RseP (regulator of RpoE activity)
VTSSSIWLFVLGIIIFLVGLAFSIGLHELGHLIPAKIFKVPVSKYFIGFGPKIFSKKVGETEYGVKAIPLGGYISIAGMYPSAPSSGASTSTQKRGIRGFFSKIVSDARESNAESLEGFDESRAFYRLPIWKRIVVMAGGPVMNLILGFVLFAILLTSFGRAGATTTIADVSQCVIPVSSTQETCTAKDPITPGAAAGLKPGDTIVAIDGVKQSSWNANTDVIHNSVGKTLQFEILRNGTTLTIPVTPTAAERYVYDSQNKLVRGADGKPKTITTGFVGIAPTTGLVQQPVTEVFPVIGETIGGTVNLIANLPARMGDVSQAAFGTSQRQIDGPISVVGIGRVAGEIASTDRVDIASKAASLLGLLASLNIALFVFNLIPLLPLDGGHIAGALWEGVRRGWAKLRRKSDPGPFDASILMPLTFVVMVALMAMSALLIYADIVKPVSIFG